MLGPLACSHPGQGAVEKPQGPKRSLAQQGATRPVLTASEVLHLRSECAKFGEKILAQNPSGNSNFTGSQLSHYNPLKNRCYVELSVRKADLSDPVSYLHQTLWDGQTGALLADYFAEGAGCPVGNDCKRRGIIFAAGNAVITGNKALSKTDDETGQDSASDAEAFIGNVMADDQKR